MKGTINNKKEYIEGVYQELVIQLSKIESMNSKDHKFLDNMKNRLKKNKKLPMFISKPRTAVKTPDKEKAKLSIFDKAKTKFRSKSPLENRYHKFQLF